jgi:hypothetical protein
MIDFLTKRRICPLTSHQERNKIFHYLDDYRDIIRNKVELLRFIFSLTEFGEVLTVIYEVESRIIP